MTGLILLLMALIASGSGSGSVGSQAKEARSAIDGLPQRGLVLGDPHASVELIEYGDLQCPYCKEYAEHKLQPLIRGPVAAGKAKLRFANFDIIGPQSTVAATAALAAGEQGRGWQFLEAFFHHQGAENSGYVDAAFLNGIAADAGIEDLARWQGDRKSARLRKEAARSTREAAKLGFAGTPSFAIRGPATHGVVALGTPSAMSELFQAIEEAAGGGAPAGEFVSAPRPAVPRATAG